MFNRKIKRDIKFINGCLDRDRDSVSKKYWELYHKHERLLQYLGLVEKVTAYKVEYTKKGGPEQA